MMSQENKLSTMESVNELLVHGFIRMYYNVNDIPAELLQLVLAFYLILMDEWNMELSDTESLTINEHLNTILSKKNVTWVNLFGTITVRKGQCQTWTVQTCKYDGNVKHWALFGIIDIEYDGKRLLSNKKVTGDWNDTKIIIPKSICNENYCSYGYYSVDGNKWSKGIWSDYGKEWNLSKGGYDEGRLQLISMKLDMSDRVNGKLSFVVDGEDQGIAFDNIDVRKVYRMFFGFYSNYDTVKLIDENDK